MAYIPPEQAFAMTNVKKCGIEEFSRISKISRRSIYNFIQEKNRKKDKLDYTEINGNIKIVLTGKSLACKTRSYIRSNKYVGVYEKNRKKRESKNARMEKDRGGEEVL